MKKMKLVAGNKYGGAREQAGSVTTKDTKHTKVEMPAVFVPTLLGSKDCLRDWYWRELKEGGFLHEYLRQEKGRTPARMRTIARFMHGFRQNARSDFRLVASVPGRVYQRWKAEDKDFFSDDSNLRSLKRDNPEACVYL